MVPNTSGWSPSKEELGMDPMPRDGPREPRMILKPGSTFDGLHGAHPSAAWGPSAPGSSRSPAPSIFRLHEGTAEISLRPQPRVNQAEQMALFKNLHCLLLFLNGIFNGDGPGRASGKVEGVGQSRPAGAETRRHSVRGLGRGWVSFHGSSLGSDGDGNDNAILMWRDEGAQLKYISRGALPGTFLWPRRGWCWQNPSRPKIPA